MPTSGNIRDVIDRREGFRLVDSDRKVQIAFLNYLFMIMDVVIVRLMKF